MFQKIGRSVQGESESENKGKTFSGASEEDLVSACTALQGDAKASWDHPASSNQGGKLSLLRKQRSASD